MFKGEKKNQSKDVPGYQSCEDRSSVSYHKHRRIAYAPPPISTVRKMVQTASKALDRESTEYRTLKAQRREIGEEESDGTKGQTD